MTTWYSMAFHMPLLNVLNNLKREVYDNLHFIVEETEHRELSTGQRVVYESKLSVET